MDYLTYSIGLITVAILSSWFTAMIYKEKRRRRELCLITRIQRDEEKIKSHGSEPHTWFWWVGTDPELRKEYILAVVAKNLPEAKRMLGPRNLKLSATTRLRGGHHDTLQPGRHVLVARSLSEINVEGM